MTPRAPKLIQPSDPGDARSTPMDEACGLADPAQAMADFMKAQRALGASFGEALGCAAAVFGETSVQSLFDGKIGRMKDPKTILAFLDGVAKSAPGVAQAWMRAALADGGVRGPLWAGTPMLDFSESRAWMDALPPKLRVQGSLSFQGRTDLTELGADDLEVTGMLALSGCVSLNRLPGRLQVGFEPGRNSGGFTLRGCRSLVELPSRLRVAGPMDLRDCVSLVSLPGRLDVGGELDLRGCLAWDGRIPDDAHVGYGVRTDSYPGGIMLGGLRRAAL